MIATTISSSMRVKPLALRIFITLSLKVTGRCRRPWYRAFAPLNLSNRSAKALPFVVSE
jgi:hypothetical protein